MKLGIDVSENNGYIDWAAVRDAGVEFAIIRSSYGLRSQDDLFQYNVNCAHEQGIICGAYHYSYALNPYQAAVEAKSCRNIIANAGVLLELNVFFDMEDADGYKRRNGFYFGADNVTEICQSFIDNIQLNTGIYASYDWLDNYIDWRILGCPVWTAAWLDGSNPDVWNNLDQNPLPAYLWQYTDSLYIAGKYFDGDVMYE